MITPEQQAKIDEIKAQHGIQSPATSQSNWFEAAKQAAEKTRMDREVEEQPGVLGTVRGIANDAYKTLIAKPATRLAQLEATGIGKLVGGEYGQKLQENAKKDLNVPSPFGKPVRVEGQKEFGEGGARQIAGDVAKSASYLAPVPAVGSSIGAIGGGKILQGGVQGALAGGIGGGLTELGEGLGDENKSAGEVATQTAVGTGLGAAVGGIMGGTGAAIAKGVHKAFPTKEEKNALITDIVSPKITPVKGRKDLISGNAKIEAPGILTPGKVSYAENPRIQKIVDVTQDVIDPRKSNSANFSAVKEHIEDTSNRVVRPFLEENKVPFNFEDLRRRMELVTPDSSLKADPSALSTYARIREDVLEDVARYLRNRGEIANETNMAELWDARKIIDSKIERELGQSTFGSPQYTGAKAAARDMREQLNKFIVDSLANPGQAEKLNVFYDFLQTAREKGIDIRNESDAIKLLRRQIGINDFDENLAKAAFYKGKIESMNLMYEALENIAPKAIAEAGKNGIQLWIKAHPIAAKALGFFAAGAAGAAGWNTISGGVSND